MDQQDYPWLQRAAEAASLKSQESYFRTLKAQLTLFSAITILSSFLPVLDPETKKITYFCIGGILLLGVLVVSYLREKRPDRTWFDGRAIAESCKTLSWRYMMRSKPFQGEDAERLFLAELARVRAGRPGIEKHLAAAIPDGPEITGTMKRVRCESLFERKAYYIQHRATDQIIWYSGKSQTNDRNANKWFYWITGLQSLAVVYAFLSGWKGPFMWNAIGPFMTLAASFAAWTQARRHEELSNSYSMAAQELREIRSLVESTDKEENFIELVDQGEEAVSREHTMWCARRSISLPQNKKS